MRKHAYKAIISLLLIVVGVWYICYDLYPTEISDLSSQSTEFSTLRAFEHVKNIADEPHYIGSDAHNNKRNYIVNVLESMGLQVQTQQDFVLSKSGVLTAPENIITRIKSTDPQPDSKALLLLSHYDSAVHTSSGSADAASGVAVILEAVRAFLADQPSFRNDIIIVFTDAEEVGLLGAKLFVEEHPWIDDVGLVLNFESRGSGGPSNMIVETNAGNRKLINLFKSSQGEYPLANSLMYSVYKLLPNDTDSTMFRELADVPSFFFAFIDDHYDYHTALDVPERLDKRSLAHQGDYLMAGLNGFSNANLTDLKSEQDTVYFTISGLGLFHYPFSWVWVMYIVALIAFVMLVIFGFKRSSLNRREVFLGFVPWLLSLIVGGGGSFLGWHIILYVYPEYESILQGFPYNGQDYIVAFVAFTVFVLFAVYQFFDKQLNPKNAIIAPLATWFVVLLLLNIILKGAAFFIIPLFFTLLAFFLMIRFQAPSLLVLLILSIPALAIITPFIQFFPVGLGLKMLVISAVFTVLLWGLLMPVFGYYSIKKGVAAMALLVSIGFFIKAHLYSDFTASQPRPNSLVYALDSEQKKAQWLTYDDKLDSWNEPYFEESDKVKESAGYQSKYSLGFRLSSKAQVKPIPQSIVQVDTLESSNPIFKKFRVRLSYQRSLNRIIVSEPSQTNFKSFQVNGRTADGYDETYNSSHVHFNRFKNNIIDYYVVNQAPLEFVFEIETNKSVEFVFHEISFDLLTHPQFSVKKRPKYTMPMPFVVNDAVIVTQKLKL